MRKILITLIAAVSLLLSGSCFCEDPDTGATIVSITPAEPRVGEEVTFVGRSSHTPASYSWFSSINGHLGEGSTFSTSSLSAGLHNITLTTHSLNCKPTSVSTTLRVAEQSRSGLPVIEYFTITPTRVNPNSNCTLRWAVSAASTLSIDNNIGDITPSGSIQVYVTADTTYTLTASNEFGSVTATATVRVIVPPVIDSFSADPATIESGRSSTLMWSVRNATGISLSATGEPGSPGWTQTVSASGSITVSPASTTNYKLTATNDFGSVSKTVELSVYRRPAPEGNPDLIITDIRKIEHDDGYRVSYTIKNQGAVTAGPSTTKLYAGGRYWDADSVGTLMPGQWVTREFMRNYFNPLYTVIEVRADADNAVREGNEGNNSKQETLPLETGCDFVANAAGAGWSSGPPTTRLTFGGNTSDDRGFVCYLSNVRMEDGRTYSRGLVTHPRWVYNGYIEGTYMPKYKIRPGDYFIARAGIVEGRTAGRVSFNAEYMVATTTMTMFDRGITIIHNGSLETISYRFPSETFGWLPVIKLIISTDGESTQDWACWIEAKIVR